VARAEGSRAEGSLVDGGWGVVRSPELRLKLALPDARNWLAPRARSSSEWELRHEASSSTISIRRFPGSRLPRVDACEAELRQRTPGLLTVDETTLVSAREVRVPTGFVTRITLLASPGKLSRFQGEAIAVSAGIGECLAVVARTECVSEAELAERLRLFDFALGHLRLTQVEDRIAPVQVPR
jgi:hypothetical protein